MKMRNDDIRKITEIKQYLFDPPVSFKLHEYALRHIRDATTILSAYSEAEDVKNYLIGLYKEIGAKTIPTKQLKNLLKQAGFQISRLTNK
jgi:hypothetical protein